MPKVPPHLPTGKSQQSEDLADRLAAIYSEAHEAGIAPEVLAQQLATREDARKVFSFMTHTADHTRAALVARVDATLVFDPEDDKTLKVSILKHLADPISARNSLSSAMQGIVDDCFAHDIPEERLIAYFNSDQMISYMIFTVFGRLKSNTRPGTGQLDANEAIENLFQQFKCTYDPTKRNVTVAAFAQNLIKRFPGDTAERWLKNNEQRFVDFLRGENGEGEINHISNMVEDCYSDRGKDSPEKYIRQHLPKFFKESIIREGDHRKTVLTLDINALQNFFYSKLPSIYTDNFGPAELREILTDLCIREIAGIEIINGPEADDLIINVTGHQDHLSFIDPEELAQTISDHTATEDSFNGFLVDPKHTPLAIRDYYKFWHTMDSGREEYEKWLKLYGYAAEKLYSVKELVKSECRAIDTILLKIADQAGFNEEQKNALMVSDKVRNTNCPWELVKIANESDSEAERFAARRKFELFDRFFHSKVRRYAYRKDDAFLVQEKLQSLGETGIEISEVPEILKVYMVGGPNGHIEIEDPSEEEDVEEPTKEVLEKFKELEALISKLDESGLGDLLLNRDFANLRERTGQASRVELPVKLVQAKFCGIRGYLIVFDYDEMDNLVQWVDVKSDASTLLKLLRKKEMVEKMMDLVRITFIVENNQDLEKIPQLMRRYYFSLGSGVKLKDGYRKVQILPAKYKPNKATASEYNADLVLQYVGKTMVKEQSTIDEVAVTHPAQFEIRFGVKDLLMEKATGSGISHDAMKRGTAREVIAKKLAPAKIKFFKDNLYEEKGSRGLVLKDA